MKKWTIPKTASILLVAMLFLAQVLVAEASPLGKGPPNKPAEWTFMVYIDGDNSLDAYVVPDIETELAPTGSNADVSVVVLADRAETADWAQTLLFYVTQGMQATPENAVDDWGEANMGDPQTLIDFIAWTKANYPAKHYALSFWNHGWSWRPGSSMADETDEDTLDQHEIEAALEAAGAIDVIMYDACQMATIENEATVRAYSQAIVHSQEWVNWDGIEYELVIPALHEDPTMSPEELAIVVNQSAAINKELTGSAVALNADWDALIAAVDNWAIALQGGLPAYRTEIWAAFHNTQSFVQDITAKDLYDLAYNVGSRITNEEIYGPTQAVMDAVDAVILDEWHATKYHGAHGISIFAPTRVRDLDSSWTTEWNDFEYYQNELVFSEMTNWDEFLDEFVNGE